MTFRSRDFEVTLSKPDIHKKWSQSFRSIESESFYRNAISKIAEVVDFRSGKKLLDAGCGTCSQSIRLARYKIQITAIDKSSYAIEQARNIIYQEQLQGDINILEQDIEKLIFDKSTFEYVFCWGTIMHIPEVEAAISELVRVLKGGGFLIISEGNMRSLQSLIQERYIRLSSDELIVTKTSKQGLEIFDKRSGDLVFRRHADIEWLKDFVCSMGFSVEALMPGQFTELHTKFRSKYIRKMVHFFNKNWFRFGSAKYAFGNIIIFRKNQQS